MQSHPTPLIDQLAAAPMRAAFFGVRNALVALALLVASAQLSSAQTVTATKDDGIPAATKVNPGANVNYTIQINATGSAATGVTLTDPTAVNTSEVAGSLNVTPVALNDTYPQNVAANMTVNTATSGFTVVTNDYPGILAGNPVALSALTITTSGTSANGGLVSMTTSGANVGRFVYSAPPGFTGTDTFTYTISNGVAGTPAGSATGTVTMNVVGPVIWFVDDSAPAGRERHLDGHQLEGLPDCLASRRGRRGGPSHLSGQRVPMAMASASTPTNGSSAREPAAPALMRSWELRTARIPRDGPRSAGPGRRGPQWPEVTSSSWPTTTRSSA